MDYEKRYKEALTRAREVHRNEYDKRSTMEFLFPELKENDENIRKRILFSLQKDIMATKNSGCGIKDLEECIAWLEKQGEQKLTWNEDDEIGLSDALWCCKQAASIAKDENDMGNIWYAERWLKSIKERMKGE